MSHVQSDASPLRMGVHHDHIHLRDGVEQVGWLGQTGAIYALDDAPYDDREPGSFAPLYVARDEECGHAIQAADAAAGVTEIEDELRRASGS